METGKNLGKPIFEKVGGVLHKIVPVLDNAGKVINSVVTPLQVEVTPKDLFQMVVGAYLLAVPVAFTEEVWVLSEELPVLNISIVACMALTFITCFIYHNFYRNNLKQFWFQFLKRIVVTYGITLLAVAAFLTVIGKCPWNTDVVLAVKRLILVSFPASMSATLSDTIK